MIAYRAEVWCQGCRAHYGAGRVHDDPEALLGLAQDLVVEAVADGWTVDGDAHWCLGCTREREASGTAPAMAQKGGRQ